MPAKGKEDKPGVIRQKAHIPRSYQGYEVVHQVGPVAGGDEGQVEQDLDGVAYVVEHEWKHEEVDEEVQPRRDWVTLEEGVVVSRVAEAMQDDEDPRKHTDPTVEPEDVGVPVHISTATSTLSPC